MGKATKLVRDPKNISKHASKPLQDPSETQNSKQRIEAELHLLKLRGKTIDGPTGTKKTGGGVTKKRVVSAKKQRKIARALVVADKEEARVERQHAKKEMRKVRKQDWTS